MKEKQVRKPRSYKVNDRSYKKAMKIAKKHKKSLAKIVEMCVEAYGNEVDSIHFLGHDTMSNYTIQ